MVFQLPGRMGTGGSSGSHSQRRSNIKAKDMVPTRQPGGTNLASAQAGQNSYGNSTTQVKDLQRRLGLAVDGSYGPATRQAVRDYQQRMGLTVDGIAGPETWNSLKGIGSGNRSGTTPGGTRSIQPDDSMRAYTGSGSASSVNDWIDTLRSELDGGGSGPNLPDAIDLDKYRTDVATIQDIANKYGFDYSREYAEQQAEVLAQAQRDEVASARERQEYETQAAQENLEHDFFQQYLQQRQNLVDTGLNAGIASERQTRLDMNRQNALADILANSQLYNQELDRRLSTIAAEEAAYADQLYNERLQQGFGNAMDYTRLQQGENQWAAQMAMQQRQQQVDEAWREYEWNNMSAAEKARLVADAEQFGMEMAWRRHEFDAGLQFQAGLSSFNQTSGGGGDGLVHTPASNTALNVAQNMGLRMTSGYRDPAENARVGGSKNSDHLSGTAYDFAGDWNAMNEFANWARNSGLFRRVLWQTDGHYDHVHVAW